MELGNSTTLPLSATPTLLVLTFLAVLLYLVQELYECCCCWDLLSVTLLCSDLKYEVENKIKREGGIDNKRQDKARQDKARQGRARQGKAK